jgi:hypothetical protein
MGIVYDHLHAGQGANYYPEDGGDFLTYDWDSCSWVDSFAFDGSMTEGPYIRCRRYSGEDVVERVRSALASTKEGHVLFVWDSDPMVVGLVWSDRLFPAGGESKFTAQVPGPVAGSWPELLSSGRS